MQRKALIAVIVVACTPAPSRETRATLPRAAPTNDLTLRFPERMHTTIVETQVSRNGRTQRVIETRARWIRDDGGRKIYEEASADGTTITFIGDALGNLAETDPTTHALANYDPPQIVVPPSPTIGMRWRAGHRIGDRVSSTLRECEIVAGERCAQGLTSHCVSHMASGKIVDMRVHFCDGAGYVGEDDFVTNASGEVILQERYDDIRDVP